MKKDKFLEKYHNRTTYDFIIIFINILFFGFFVLLLVSWYEDWWFGTWIQRPVFIVLLIILKILFNKIFKKYRFKLIKNKKIINVIEYFVDILFVVLMILFFKGFYNDLCHKLWSWSETWNVLPLFIVLYIVFWIFFNKLFDSIFLSSFKIDENMDFLPKSIKWKKSLVQYDLSRDIAPCEAWMLLYGEADISNLLSIIYKRFSDKIVDIYSENWITFMKVICNLWENVPYYEKYLFEHIFYWRKDSLKYIEKRVELNKYLLLCYNREINDLIFEKCKLKWYCINKQNKFFEFFKKIWIFLLFAVFIVTFKIA